MSAGMQEFHGLIVPSAWEGDVLTQISLLTYDEEEYIIVLNKEGKLLFKNVREEVSLLGEILNRDNKRYIRVHKFVLVNLD